MEIVSIEPIKLNLNSIDKVITTENKNSVRIRLINKNNPKIKYVLKSKWANYWSLETKQKVEITKNTTDSNSKTNLPQKISNKFQTHYTKNAINKTIVIDAGHGRWCWWSWTK